jgi:hypothetical protein
MSRYSLILLFTAFAMAATPALPASADPIDGSKALVCSTNQTHDCDSASACDDGDPDDVRVPSLFKIDFGKKTITTLDEDRRGEVTKISSITKTERTIVLQGAEGNRGWTLLIGKEAGDTVLTVSDEYAGFVVFGACARP